MVTPFAACSLLHNYHLLARCGAGAAAGEQPVQAGALGGRLACTFPLRHTGCAGVSLASDCWNAFNPMLLMGKGEKVSIVNLFFFISSFEVQMLGWRQLTVPSAPTGALVVASGAGLCWEQQRWVDDLAVNYHSNVFHLFHHASCTPATAILKIKL